MTEKVVIPAADQIEVVPRRLTEKTPDDYLPYEINGNPVPEFARAGDGYRFHSTGLTHDQHGYPVMSIECQETCVRRLLDKILEHADDIIRIEGEALEDADVVVVAYGITARVARMATEKARRQGIKVGFFRLLSLWPFPEKQIRALAAGVRGFVVPEINYGQMVLEVERCAAGQAVAVLVPHGGGGVHDPEVIVQAIVEVVR